MRLEGTWFRNPSQNEHQPPTRRSVDRIVVSLGTASLAQIDKDTVAFHSGKDGIDLRPLNA